VQSTIDTRRCTDSSRLRRRAASPGKLSYPARWQRITAKVGELTAAGAMSLEAWVGHRVVMADPEGNECCAC
jgi:hypothetical protein